VQAAVAVLYALAAAAGAQRAAQCCRDTTHTHNVCLRPVVTSYNSNYLIMVKVAALATNVGQFQRCLRLNLLNLWHIRGAAARHSACQSHPYALVNSTTS
jgi:hypothetical protein